MRKFGIFSLTIFVSIIFAGLYGILHNQITYTIAPEYFTKFKYAQFGFDPQPLGGNRSTVAVIGFLAAWWTGAFIGFGLALTALGFRDHKTMQKAILKAILLTFCFAVTSGFLGFFYGKFVSTTTGAGGWLPNNLVDKNAFITVRSVHNFSYLGALLGLIAGVYYLVRLKKATP